LFDYKPYICVILSRLESGPEVSTIKNQISKVRRTMKYKNPTFVVVALSVLLTSFGLSRTVEGQQTWRATLGGQSKDMGKQAIAFLPNELWIHAGDSITWTSASADIHTVSFLVAGQKVNPFTVGCPGYSPSGSSFDGSSCMTALPLVTGQEFTVKFPMAGNFKLICLVHPHMTGVIHVLAASADLPHNQDFYNEQAEAQQRNLLADTDRDKGHHDMDDMISAHVLPRNGVAAGGGEVTSNAGGFQSLSVDRFMHGTIEVRVGDTVEWSAMDPADPHTVTFGVEPMNPGPPSANVSFDADGGRHATLNAPGDSTHSGIIGGVPENQIGVAQSPASIPVFRVTFKGPGTYDYKCALHDNLGMVGKVIVEP
jgi:plastocyanin